jgi:uncharacterized protein (DUF433 family)/DNA-binding transcriptional MerR regulator
MVWLDLAALLDCDREGRELTGLVSMPPRGHYSANEAGWLAGVPAKTLCEWASRGYVRASQQSRPPLIFSYQDVAEAMVVHELLDRGVPGREVKKAVRTLREEYGDWPLSRAKLATVRHDASSLKSSVVAELEDHVYDVGKTGNWQQVINPQYLGLIATWLERGGWAARVERDIEHVEVNPERLSGRPTIRGHRIDAAMVGRMAQTDGGQALLRKEYRLKEAEISDALRWWRAAEDARTSAAA